MYISKDIAMVIDMYILKEISKYIPKIDLFQRLPIQLQIV